MIVEGLCSLSSAIFTTCLHPSQTTLGVHDCVTVLDVHHTDTTLGRHDRITVLDVHHADTTIGRRTVSLYLMYTTLTPH